MKILFKRCLLFWRIIKNVASKIRNTYISKQQFYSLTEKQFSELNLNANSQEIIWMLDRLFAQRRLDVNLASAKFDSVKKEIACSHAQRN